MPRLILLNKPFNVLCQFTDKEGRPTLADYIDQQNVYPAGRLDYDSEGLVLLTDSGELQHQISHPGKKMAKTYWLQVEGDPEEKDLQPLRHGITLKDGPCRPAKVRKISEPTLWPRTPPVRHRKNIATSWLEIQISEGRNRQLRRMAAAIGFPVLRLVRIRIGDWSLQDLPTGHSRQLELHMPVKRAPSRGRTTKPSRRV